MFACCDDVSLRSKNANTSILLYEPYANESSQICPFLAARTQFDSDHRLALAGRIVATRSGHNEHIGPERICPLQRL